MIAPRLMLAVGMALTALAAAAPATAHGHSYGGARGDWYGPSVRLYYGGPLWWSAPGFFGFGYGSAYWPPHAYGTPQPYVWGPPGVMTSTAGVVYIEREQGAVASQQTPSASAPAAAVAAEPAPPPSGQWWYLCDSPRGAYPYVRECPGGWDRVPAIPPGTIR